jgi:outer membrane protein assembly factor BamB
MITIKKAVTNLLLVGAIATSALASTALAEDWPMWGRTYERRMNSSEKNAPTEWDVEANKNVKWSAQLGSQSYANPVIAGGLIFQGTNNEAKRDPKHKGDASCLMIFRESDGKFLYQRVSEKLPAGRVVDWPYQGICSTGVAEGDFFWYCTSRCEVVCLDVSPLRKGEGDPKEVWVNDMMETLAVFPHNMTSCSPLIYEDYIYVITGNGVDESHKNVPSPKAPAVVCFEKKTGKVVWSDNSPREGILHGQWASPTLATVNGVTQIICPLGDSWVRSFEYKTGKLLWQFDTNIKDSVYPTTRNELIATPLVVDNLMYIATGQDPEHGEGPGRLWCVDISKGKEGADISLEKEVAGAVKPKPGDELLAPADQGRTHKGEPNPYSAVVWQFAQVKAEPGVKIARKDKMNRSISTASLADGILYQPDFSGFLHVFDAKTGERLWVYDTEAAIWGSPLIADGKVYVCNEEGSVVIFKHGRKMEKIAENNLGSASYCSPVFANQTLYVTNREKLFAIQASK